MAQDNWSDYAYIAKDYEKGRPDYPAEAIAFLCEKLHLTQGKAVLDLAAGTGKLSKAMAFSNVNLYAVEPVEAMRNEFSRLLPSIPVFDGTAEAVPFSDETFDAVVVGTAFHWFNAEKAIDEIARVLKPGGRLGLIWNIFDETVDWVKTIRGLVETQERKTHDHTLWKKAFANIALFGQMHHQTIRYSFDGTAQDVLDRIFSAKAFGKFTQDEKRVVVDQVLAVLASHPETKGKNVFPIPYKVELYWCQRNSPKM